jgi:hypothetical protein
MRGFLLSAFTYLAMYAWSCDICGGIGSNVSAGMLLNERFHLIGIRSANRMTTSYLEGIRHSREFIFAQELYCRIQARKRIQLIASIPYQSGLQKRDLGQTVFFGIGDPYAYLNGIALHRKDSTGSTRTFLSMGGGIKFPLGTYSANQDGFQNLYPGTGSWDILTTFTLVQKVKDRWSFQAEAGYTFKNSNPSGFRYGNNLTTSAQLTHYAVLKRNRLLYGLGGFFDHFEKSVSATSNLGENTNSGYTTGIRINTNYLSRKWLISSQMNIPVMQKLNNGSVNSIVAIQLGIHYLIKSNMK